MSNRHAVLNCPSKSSCFCKKRHHKSLHFPKQNASAQENQTRGFGFEDEGKPRDSAFAAREARHQQPQDPRSEVGAGSAGASRSLNPDAPDFKQSSNTFMSSYSNHKVNKALLGTINCVLRDSNGNEVKVRCLLDSGSESCFLTKRVADILQLRKEKINVVVSGLSDSSQTVKTRVNASICNEDRSFEKNLDFLLMPKIKADSITESQCLS